MENLRYQLNFWKGIYTSIFPDGMLQKEIRVPFLQIKAIFYYQFQGLHLFFGNATGLSKINVKRDPARNLLVLNFGALRTYPNRANLRLIVYSVYTKKCFRLFTVMLRCSNWVLMVFTVTSSDYKVKKARFYEFLFTLD